MQPGTANHREVATLRAGAQRAEPHSSFDTSSAIFATKAVSLVDRVKEARQLMMRSNARWGACSKSVASLHDDRPCRLHTRLLMPASPDLAACWESLGP